jgi:DnaJ-class molecular chaperone
MEHSLTKNKTIYWYNMAEFVYDPNCPYCKGTGQVPMLIRSKPCLDCKKNYTTETRSDNEIIILEEDFGDKI